MLIKTSSITISTHCLLQSTPDLYPHTHTVNNQQFTLVSYVSFKFSLLHLQMKLTFNVLCF